MISEREISALRALARTCCILPSFENNDGHICWAPPETLVTLINSLEGETIVDPQDPDTNRIREILAVKRRRRLLACLPEICVAWEGRISIPDIWLPESLLGQTLEIVITNDDTGERLTNAWSPDPHKLQLRGFGNTGRFFKTAFNASSKIPFGYYTLELQLSGLTKGKSFLISAPTKLPLPPYSWGAFGPAYAMRSLSDWGIGSFRELLEVCRFIREQGGSFVGTLPLLAGFMEGRHTNPSPYSPLSRLYWNEVFLDIENLPGIEKPEIEDGDKHEISRLRKEELIDYRAIYALKKKYILKAASSFFASGGENRDDFRNFLYEYPGAPDYAEFRSAEFPPEDREDMRRFHLYSQFAIHSQLLGLREKAASGQAAELYLDYPVGVHNEGFDARKMHHLFIPGFNVGAPPDDFSEYGQDWGFMPMHPAKLADDRFNYFRDSIHNYFRYARIVRLDHIMGFYRIFCVPHGGKPACGAYIKYPLSAFLAVLCLETWRHNGILIGEDLGTVPPAVRKAMNRHGLLRMWLFQFYLQKNPGKTFRDIPEMSLAALNTHDMAPFASFFEGEDIKRLESVGAFGPERSAQLTKDRKDILKGWKEKKNPFIFVMQNMAASSARFLLINLEDLWGEKQPQNLPGTTDQHPNWRRKFRKPLEAWTNDASIKDLLTTIDNHRKQEELE